MSKISFSSTRNPNTAELHRLLTADPDHLHIHTVDMPYRETSIWQDLGCEFGIWSTADEILGWAVFQPAWWNLDFAVVDSKHVEQLEKEIFEWGIDQMKKYSLQTGDEFWGSVEIFADSPLAERTIRILEQVGFTKFDWSTLRLELDLQKELPEPQLPYGYRIRPLKGKGEAQAYVNLHRATFDSEKMTLDWRLRTLEHPAYHPDLDLVVVDGDDLPVGFCVCWLWHDLGQIEPLGIHPEQQGKGLGSALELAACHALQNLGARKVLLDHVSLNEGANALSQQTGFHRNNDALRYYVSIG